MVRIGRRSWKELEDTVAAAVESSGVGYLRPLVCFIPCDYYRSGDDTTPLFAALRHMTSAPQRNPIRSPFNLAFLTSPNASAARTTGRTFSTALPIAAPPVGNHRSVSRSPPRQQDLTAQHPGRRRHPGMNRPPVSGIGHLGRGRWHGMRGEIFQWRKCFL